MTCHESHTKGPGVDDYLAEQNDPERCRCNTQSQNPDCHIDHTFSILQAHIAFPQRASGLGEPCETCGGEGYGKVPPDYGFCGPECPDCLGTGVQP